MRSQTWSIGLGGLLLSLALALPARANQLLFWRLDASQNRLEFKTQGAIAPQAQLIFNPQRIVIDLPGAALPAQRSPIRGSAGIREIRVGQPEAGVTRIVVEIAPGYTVDPSLLRVEGLDATTWQVRLQPALRFAGGGSPLPPRSPVTPPPPQQPQLPPPLPPQSGRSIVVIDPGHGGPDAGAVGIGGIREKDIVFDISQQVASILRNSGIDVRMTRTADIDLDLEPRVQVAEQARADLFVSIHANAISLDRPEVNGLETYFYASQSGERLARTIHQSILSSISIRDRGVRQARFYVIRRTSMPAVLVETGFVTGSEDARNLANPNHRRKMAEAIARGILQYVRQN
ncbi:N-acetylmuramoyl-L-alanine amidase [Synechococcus elongatus]|uniref:N-acetylmuramoyl-L-alanine amidase n=1 Tax=Synechococcus elongatus PCC 11802 TaxID=2283154 RepID=A0AAT9JWU5_SYNEL|nr:N-acetylmuramoyl-L-alanine amidase [Synechococcus elongatus]QFZ91890.1 N-acetylmuramoyl-L-alanine amidase [Synechococcus elongatus PCC 11802]